MQISVRFDTERLKQDLRREQQRVASAARYAINRLAWRAHDAIVADMKDAFDRPTPYILNGMAVDQATAGETVAVVRWKEPRGGNKGAGPGAERILLAQIFGGARRQKGFERLLGLPQGWAAVPGRNVRLDQYGNLPNGLINQMLSALRAFGEQGYLANQNRAREERRKARIEAKGKAYKPRRAPRTFFLVAPGDESQGRLPPGIYRRMTHKRGQILVVAFVKAPRYARGFMPATIAQRAVQRNAAEVWNLALQRQLPSRR